MCHPYPHTHPATLLSPQLKMTNTRFSGVVWKMFICRYQGCVVNYDWNMMEVKLRPMGGMGCGKLKT